MNEQCSPYTIEVCSETAVIMRINIATFRTHFGGEEGEPIMQLRSNIIMKNNWLQMKMQFLAYMDKSKLS